MPDTRIPIRPQFNEDGEVVRVLLTEEWFGA